MEKEGKKEGKDRGRKGRKRENNLLKKYFFISEKTNF